MSSFIDEFLVGLGFKVDELGLKKFKGGVGLATQAAEKLGAEAFTAASAVQLAVVKIAAQYAQLHWMSQRTGASIGNLQNFAFGTSQIGIAAEQSTSAIEGLATAIRTNPGKKGLLNSLGIATAGRDTKDIFDDLIGKLKEMEKLGPQMRPVTAGFAAIFGIDEPILDALIKGDAKRKVQEADLAKRMKAAGIDPKKMDDQFRGFSETLQTFESNLGILGQRLGLDWVEDAKKVLNVINSIVEALNNADAASGGWATTIETIMVGSFSAWIAKAVVLNGLLRAIGMGGGGSSGKDDVLNKVRKGGRAGLGGLLLRGVLGPVGVGLWAIETANEAAKTPEGKAFKATGHFWHDFYGLMHAMKPTIQGQFGIDEHAGDGPPSSIPTGSDRDMLIRTVLGEAGNQADIGKTAVAEVILNRLKSGRYGKSVSDVVLAPKQFEPWSTRRNELMAISPDSAAYQRTAALVDQVLRGQVEDPTHGAVNFANVGIVQSRGNAAGMSWINDMIANGSAVQIGDHLFGSPTVPTGTLAPPGSGGAPSSIVVTNTFNVSTSDPHTAAREVLDGQQRVQGDIIRNTVGAVR